MENWGLVSYREMFLLFNPLIQTTRNKEFIITIIAHEFLVCIYLFFIYFFYQILFNDENHLKVISLGAIGKRM